jgi:hypothetical protein
MNENKTSHETHPPQSELPKIEMPKDIESLQRMLEKARRDGQMEVAIVFAGGLGNTLQMDPKYNDQMIEIHTLRGNTTQAEVVRNMREENITHAFNSLTAMKAHIDAAINYDGDKPLKFIESAASPSYLRIEGLDDDNETSTQQSDGSASGFKQDSQ